MLTIKKLFYPRILLWCTVIFCVGCSCSSNRPIVKIAIDPLWHPINVTKLNSNIYGFVEELLLLVSKETNYEFERECVNWNDLTQGLEDDKYDAILSFIKPYNFNTSRFDFSKYIILETGPVLVYSASNTAFDIKNLSGKIVSVPISDMSVLLLQKNPLIIIDKYSSVEIALNSIAQREISAALVDQLQAHLYIRDLYRNELKMTQPLEHEGMRFITKKGKNKALMSKFNNAIRKLEKKGCLKKIKEKWDLK